MYTMWFLSCFIDEKFLREMLESSKFFENNSEVKPRIRITFDLLVMMLVIGNNGSCYEEVSENLLTSTTPVSQ
jgi:hypothetical protein